ncbi:hypothetical protein [Streptomyces sp. NPDC054838]
MAAKISKTMTQKLLAALTDDNHEMIGAATNTERAMIERGLVSHQKLRTRITDKRGHQVRTHGLVLTEDGLTKARRLAGEQASAPAPAAPVAPASTPAPRYAVRRPNGQESHSFGTHAEALAYARRVPGGGTPFELSVDAAPALLPEAWKTPAPAPQPLPKGAPEGTEERAAKMTPHDVADAVEDAMQWLPFSHRDTARTQPASVTLAAELERAGAVMRRALKHNGPTACMSAILQYERVTAALVAARRLEAATA